MLKARGGKGGLTTLESILTGLIAGQYSLSLIVFWPVFFVRLFHYHYFHPTLGCPNISSSQNSPKWFWLSWCKRQETRYCQNNSEHTWYVLCLAWPKFYRFYIHWLETNGISGLWRGIGPALVLVSGIHPYCDTSYPRAFLDIGYKPRYTIYNIRTTQELFDSKEDSHTPIIWTGNRCCSSEWLGLLFTRCSL